MKEQLIADAGNSNPAFQRVTDPIDAIRSIEEAEDIRRHVASREAPAPAEDILQRRGMMKRSRDNARVRGGRDAGESIIAGLQFAQQLEERISVAYHNSRR
jgi:hypothetical protein